MHMKEQQQEGNRPQIEARPVRLNPKVVFWIAMAATGIALSSFSVMFIDAGFRNGWW